MIRKILLEIYAYVECIVFSWPGFIGNNLRTWIIGSGAKSMGSGCYVEKGCHFRGLKHMSFGSQVSIGSNSHFFSDNGTISVGDKTSFNINCNINASMGGNIVIGTHCLVGPNVVIHTANHKFDNLAIPIREQGHDCADIHIENNVWIGANVIILAGVYIGEGAVIAAGSVVNKSVAKNTVVGGVPAHFIKNRQ